VVERDRPAGALTQPCRDAFRMTLRQRQQLAADAVAQRRQHQHRHQRVPGAAAQQTQAVAPRHAHHVNA